VTALEEVVAGLKTLLDTIYGLEVYDHPAANLELPAAIIVPPEIDYRQAMRTGTIRLEFEIVVFVSAAAGHDSSKKLWPYIDWTGEKSILQAIEVDPTLGIVGADGQPRVDAHVYSERRLGFEELPEGAFGVALQLPVIVTNKE